MTDNMEYICLKKINLSELAYNITCEYNSRSRLFYVSNKDDSLDINSLEMYQTKPSVLLNNVVCKSVDGDTLASDYLKNTVLDIHNLLVSKSYNEIIQSQDNEQSWIRYFSMAISHFNNMNYKDV